MKVNFTALNERTNIPVKFFKKDFCYDVTATSEEEVAPNVWKYGIGLAFQIDREDISDDGSTLLSIDLRSRSSIWKTGMVLSNGTGTIDELYNGEVSVVFYHVMLNMPRYKVGDRIGQIKAGISVNLDFNQVEELTTTERGNNGYGSTGK